MRLCIARTWDGRPVEPAEQAVLELEVDATSVRLTVDAPYHGDPRPPASPGRLDRLWEHEVVELFLLGADDRYLEVELGPHGHYLVLVLAGRRQVERQALLIEYAAEITGRRWRGWARLPRAYLPPRVERGNAYAIHGVGAARRYLACFPVPGERPDFHRLEAFGPLLLV